MAKEMETAESGSIIERLTNGRGVIGLALSPVTVPIRLVNGLISRIKRLRYKDRAVDLGPLPDFSGFEPVHVPDPGLWIGKDGGVRYAVSDICPHLGCIVKWDKKKAEFACPCHGSRFSVKGEVLKGPSKQPLQKIKIETARGRLLAFPGEEAD